MTTLTFITDMTKALAWPVVLLFIVMMFRKVLVGLPERLMSLRYGEFQVSFADQAAKVAETLSESREAPLLASKGDAALFDLAARSPRAAIFQAWLQVEDRLRALSVKTGIGDPLGPARGLSHALAKGGIFDEKLLETLEGLMVLRNVAAHGPDTLTKDKAVEFLTLADAVMHLLARK